MLEVENLHVHYGGIHALRGVSISVGQGEIVTIIGANGAGKSTLLNAISGIVRTSEGADLQRSPLPTASYAIVKQGICQVPRAGWSSPT